MIKTIYICDKCKKQKTDKADASGFYVPKGWVIEFYQGTKHYCSKKCKPKRKIKYVSTRDDYDHTKNVGSLYGRT